MWRYVTKFQMITSPTTAIINFVRPDHRAYVSNSRVSERSSSSNSALVLEVALALDDVLEHDALVV